MEKLTARYERQDDHLWKAHVDGAPELTAAGRSLTAAQERIHAQAAEQGYGDEIEDLVELPEASQSAVTSALEARRAVINATERAQELLAEAARQVISDGLSLRDTAALLGISHTRVQQLLRDQ